MIFSFSNISITSYQIIFVTIAAISTHLLLSRGLAFLQTSSSCPASLQWFHFRDYKQAFYFMIQKIKPCLTVFAFTRLSFFLFLVDVFHAFHTASTFRVIATPGIIIILQFLISDDKMFSKLTSIKKGGRLHDRDTGHVHRVHRNIRPQHVTSIG